MTSLRPLQLRTILVRIPQPISIAVAAAFDVGHGVALVEVAPRIGCGGSGPPAGYLTGLPTGDALHARVGTGGIVLSGGAAARVGDALD